MKRLKGVLTKGKKKVTFIWYIDNVKRMIAPKIDYNEKKK